MAGDMVDLHHLQLTDSVNAPPIRGPATAPSMETSLCEKTDTSNSS